MQREDLKQVQRENGESWGSIPNMRYLLPSCSRTLNDSPNLLSAKNVKVNVFWKDGGLMHICTADGWIH